MIDVEIVIYGTWGRAFEAEKDNQKPCTAGDGPILAGQWAKFFYPEKHGEREIFHDDCAEQNGAYDKL